MKLKCTTCAIDKDTDPCKDCKDYDNWKFKSTKKKNNYREMKEDG